MEKITTINTNTTAKQPTLSSGTAVTDSQDILSGTIIKNIKPGIGISLINIKCKYYYCQWR